MSGILYNMVPMPGRRPESDAYKELLSYLSEAFRTRYGIARKEQRRLTGLMFARPEHALAKDSILPNMEYFHLRSGNNVDFFFAGYELHPSQGEKKPVVRIETVSWDFNNMRFDQMRKRFEEITKWQYSGGLDLILTNARYDSGRQEACFEFDTSVVCRLNEMMSCKAISSVETFLEQIFRHAEKCTGMDPTWGLSDRLATSVVRSGIKRLILSLLPKESGEDIGKLEHFAVLDLARNP